MFKIIKNLFIKKKENFGGGLLGIGESDKDFVFGSVNEFKSKLAKKANLNRDLVYEYDQGAQWETRNYCTIYSAITELSHLVDRKFSLCEIKTIGDRMIADGKLNPDKGAYLHDAIDYVRNYWNEWNPDNQVESYQIDYTDLGLLQVLDSHIPRPTQIGYRTSGAMYRATYNAPYVVGETDYPKLGGHAVTRWKGVIVNNYKKNKTTVNRFRFAHLQDLIKNGVVFQKGYIFLKK